MLLGANGAGKTTLLRILAGQHMVPREAVLVLGQSPFFNTTMISHNRLSYIGGSWRRDVAFAGYDVPMSADIRAGDMIERVHGVKASRRELLMKVLDVNPEWRLHRVSEGQRRRVQLCMGLLHEYEVLFLDEITVDLDVLVRADLVAFLRRECAERRCTVIYATHIFDGLEGWPTHVAYLARGNLQEFGTVAEFPELATGGPEKGGELVKLVEKWLRREQAIVAELRQKEREGGPLCAAANTYHDATMDFISTRKPPLAIALFSIISPSPLLPPLTLTFGDPNSRLKDGITLP